MTRSHQNTGFDRQETIIQAALEIIAENGLQSVRMSQISKRANASPGIIYHYFESKDELILTIYHRVYQNALKVFGTSELPDETLPDRYKSYWLAIYHYCYHHPVEFSFLDQFEISPLVKQTHSPFDIFSSSSEVFLSQLQEHIINFDIQPEEKYLLDFLIEMYDQKIIKDLPLFIISEFTVGVARHLAIQAAKSNIALDNTKLNQLADACWQAIAA